jgi:hypothetical protein
MARYKVNNEIHHQPSTLQVFYCIRAIPSWVVLLVNNEPDKPYIKMLKVLIERNFYKDQESEIYIKNIAKDLKLDSNKVSKWLKDAYHDIFELNGTKPELFYGTGVPVNLFMKYYDDHADLRITLPVIPREFESFGFYFVKAKVGTDNFWVHRIEHSYGEDGYEIFIWLRGGFMNKYRELLFDKAMFYDRIPFKDAIHNTENQNDEKLKRIYKG